MVQRLLHQVATNLSVGGSDGAWPLVSDVLQHSRAFVQHGAILKHEGGHVALGIDGVEVSTGSGGVGAQIDLFGFEVNTGDVGSDKRRSSARGGGVVELGHCCAFKLCKIQSVD